MGLDRLADAVVDRLVADQVDDAGSFEVLADVVADLGEDDFDASLLGLDAHLPQRFDAGVVDVGDARRVDAQRGQRRMGVGR